MKKNLTILMVALLAIAIAAPAFADVEFKYGGAFRARYVAQNNVYDGTEDPFQILPNGNPLFPANTLGSQAFSKGSYQGDDHRNFLDYRLRLFFSFIASKNLKLVTAFEVGDAIFGQGGSLGGTATGTNMGANIGANVGGDAVAVEVKSAYIEFNIPNTTSTGIVGLQPLKLLDSWIVDDDLPAAVLTTKLDPFRVTVGYVGGQNGWERRFGNQLATSNSAFNVDDVFLAVDYASGPFKANLSFFFQDGHDSVASLDPRTLTTPVRNFTGGPDFLSATGIQGFEQGVPSFGFLNSNTGGFTVGGVGLTDPLSGKALRMAKDNFLFDLGLNLTYKTDWLLAYVNFVKNFGSTDLVALPNGVAAVQTPATTVGGANSTTFPGTPTAANVATGLPGVTRVPNITADYTGFMIDAGVTYYCGPYTLNVGGFYTTGAEISRNPFTFLSGIDPASIANGTFQQLPFRNIASKDAEWFNYPLGTAKAFSEIIGGGVLGEDIHAIRGYPGSVTGASMGSTAGVNTVMWKGYYNPQNLWTITAGGSWQVLEKTKLSASYWYFGTSESVPVRWNLPRTAAGVPINAVDAFNPGTFSMSSSIGHELDFYIDQGIVDGLTLTLVGAYLIADDAFAPIATTGLENMPGRSTNIAGQVTSRGFNAENAYEFGARLQWLF